MKEIGTSKRPIILFLKAIFRYWWAYMSCAAFTFLGIWATFANQGRVWVLWGSFLLGIFFLVVAAYKAWASERQRWLDVSGQYDAKFKGLPRLAVREVISASSRERIDSTPGSFFLDDPSSYPKCTNVSKLALEFINDPVVCTPESVAKSVIATLSFYDATKGQLEMTVEGRWEKSIAQGGHIAVSSEVRVEEIPINARKTLVVAIKDERQDVCYATSVDAFHEGGLGFDSTVIDAPWVIQAKGIDAVIRVRGISVDQCWLLKFTNDGIGKGFASITYEEVEPSFTYPSERDLSRKRKRR